MSADVQLPFDNSYARELEGFYVPWQPTPVPEPQPLQLNLALARELGIDEGWLTGAAGLAVLAGNAVPPGASPLAQAYAGHQFGHFSPMLGDGRALLLGELIDITGKRRDVALKGSGRTPFSRGGDGKAVVGPVLREYLMGEAMHALGVPTTRALAAIGTGEQIRRDVPEPGAVLVRVASSHLRVGTFELIASRGTPEQVRLLADYSITRHFPELMGLEPSGADGAYLAFLRGVVGRQAELIAAWMELGFIHGVMNTDNMTISGETIDYGPCAFLDHYDPRTVFSSIDHGGRYAFGNQPTIAVWNLSRLAEALLPLIDSDDERAQELAGREVEAFAESFESAWLRRMRAKLGLPDAEEGDRELVVDLLELARRQRVDYTSLWRALARDLCDEPGGVRELLAEPEVFDAWRDRWISRLGAADPVAISERMDRVNPLYIPRNHLVEEVLDAARAGDRAPFEELLAVLATPYDEQPGRERYADPAPASFGPHITYCGT